MTAFNQRCICQICICGNHRCISSSHGMPSTSPNSRLFPGNSQQVTEGAEANAQGAKGASREDGEYFGKGRKHWEQKDTHFDTVHKSMVNLSMEKNDRGRNVSSGSMRSLPPLNGHENGETMKKDAMQTMELKSDGKVSRRVVQSPPFGTNHRVQPVIKERRQKTAEDGGGHSARGQREDREGRVSRERGGSEGNNVEVEWVVVKPQRKKPCDLLKLEGSLDMETTFHSTFERTAHELLDEYRRQKDVLDGQPDSYQRNNDDTTLKPRDAFGHRDAYFGQGVNVAGFGVSDNVSTKARQVPKTSGTERFAPIRKRSSHRPKTSLKLGGPGDYHTVSKDSFKRFVVVDVNNNGGDTTVAVDTTIVSRPKDRNGKKLPKDILTVDANDMVFKDEMNKDDGQPVSLPRLRKVTKQTNGLSVVGTSQVERRADDDVQILTIDHGTDHRNDQEERIKGDIAYQQNSTENNFEDQEQNHKELGHRNEHIDRGRRHFRTENHFQNGADQRTDRELGTRTSHGDRTTPTEHTKAELIHLNSSRIRHKSLPRTVNVSKSHHKNESHLKFEGEMDFGTTSGDMSNLIHQCINHDHQSGHMTRSHRDLFKSTNDLFSDPRSKFDDTTMYQCQFRDKHYCPAIDLGSKKSQYVYKKQANGHSFYCRAH